MSIRKLLAESRKSGPATVYELDADGVITRKTERTARSVYRAGKLSIEEKLCILLQTGIWPLDFPAEAVCGVQRQDWGFAPKEKPGLYHELRSSGIMSGPPVGVPSDDLDGGDYSQMIDYLDRRDGGGNPQELDLESDLTDEE